MRAQRRVALPAVRKRTATLSRAEKIQIQYRYSSVMHRVGGSLEFLRKDLRRDERKTIPVAVLARKFDVSTRLFWKWIADGLLSAVRGKQDENQFQIKRGVPKRAALTFLKHLQEAADLASDGFQWQSDFADYPLRDRFRVEVDSRAGRPNTTMTKIRDARRKGFDGQGMNPRQFGEAVGVSRSAVWRAIKSGELASWNPTPHRILIGRRPRTSKKVGARHRKSLTQKKRLN